jgi:hypothetical protein
VRAGATIFQPLRIASYLVTVDRPVTTTSRRVFRVYL